MDVSLPYKQNILNIRNNIQFLVISCVRHWNKEMPSLVQCNTIYTRLYT